jgi:hypothetical protein
LFGWRVAKQVQRRYNEAKWSVLRSWDKALFRFDKQRPAKHSMT